MTSYNDTKIRLHEVFIRDLINSVVDKINLDELKENQTFLSEITRKLHFDNIRGWKFLISSLDTIGDTQCAILQFCQIKEINIAENYLRLYGVLSAIYIQQRAILKICDLFKINNLKLIKSEFDDLDITFLRHCISAHPVNYSKNGGKITSFKIVRSNLSHSDGLIEVVNENNKIIEYNIFVLIKEYTLIAELYMNKIAIKLIDNVYKTAKDKAFEEKQNLEKINYARK